MQALYPELFKTFTDPSIGAEKIVEWNANPRPFDVEMHFLPSTPYGMCFRVKSHLKQLGIGGDNGLVFQLKSGIYDFFAHDPKMVVFNFYTPTQSQVHLRLEAPEGDMPLMVHCV